MVAWPCGWVWRPIYRPIFFRPNFFGQIFFFAPIFFRPIFFSAQFFLAIFFIKFSSQFFFFKKNYSFCFVGFFTFSTVIAYSSTRIVWFCLKTNFESRMSRMIIKCQMSLFLIHYIR